MRFSATMAMIGLAMLAAGHGARAQDAAAGASRQPSFALTRLASQFPPGKVWLVVQSGPFCGAIQNLRSDGALKPANLSVYAPEFARDFTAAPVAGANQGANLFASSDNDQVDYQVGGLIHDADIKICGQGVIGIKNNATISVQWQIYSASEQKVVATIETSGQSQFRSYQIDADEALRQAFAENVKQLSASTELHSVISRPVATGSMIAGGPQDRISSPTSAATPRAAGEATGSVVVVELPDGHGSGVLVSNEGYVLTNAHVVGGNPTVTIRWSDGFETKGQVIRVQRKRDVALIKTDPHGRSPLSVRTTPVQAGDTVFAIGAPLDKELQGTVTRGVVSANRIMNGFAFIQSDVVVNHGNSGGALIDDKGYLVGLTDMGLQPTGDTPIGINFFVPIKDALDFLSLDLVPAAAPPPPVQTVASQPAVKSKTARRVSTSR